MTPAERGTFITFEGPDGSGKSTQLALLAEWLRTCGVEPVLLRQPGGTALGERIRAMLLDSRTVDEFGQITPLAELALMFADRAQSICEVIQPAVLAGRVILCDRYTDSSEAYQGAGRGLGSDRVLALHRAVCDGLQPDLTILLLPAVDVALDRARVRNLRQQRTHGTDENRFEAEGEAFFRRVHAAYAAIAAREPERVRVIGGDESIDVVATRVRACVAERVATRWPALQQAQLS